MTATQTAPATGGRAGQAFAWRTEIVASAYHDSVVLMRVSALVRKEPGVREVALFMGTPANHALLQHAGLATAAGAQASPSDLIITVQAATDEVATQAVARVKELLAETRTRSKGRCGSCPTPISSRSRCPARTSGTRAWRRCAGTCTSSSSATTCRSRTRSR
jgi:hypothetical protein